jgi:hypothetical protein
MLVTIPLEINNYFWIYTEEEVDLTNIVIIGDLFYNLRSEKYFNKWTKTARRNKKNKNKNKPEINFEEISNTRTQVTENIIVTITDNNKSDDNINSEAHYNNNNDKNPSNNNNSYEHYYKI